MKFRFDQSRLYLMLGYLLVTLSVLWLVIDYRPWVVMSALAVLVVLQVLCYEPLMRSIRDASGGADRSESSLYAVLIQLNKRIHHFLDMEDVLLFLDTTLKSHLRAGRTVYLVNPELLREEGGEESGKGKEGSGKDSEEAGDITGQAFKQPRLVAWGRSGAVLNDVKLESLGEFLRTTHGTLMPHDGNMILTDAFDATKTSLAVAVTHNDCLLAVVMVAKVDERTPWSDQERELFGYLANQLSIILDRIRVYREVMRKTRMDHAEKLQVMQNLSANIAHEMRTPLAGIRASITGIENYLPTLIDAYDSAQSGRARQLVPIRDQHLNTLRNSSQRITLMIDQANAVIDMLLVNLRTSSFEQLDRCRAAACVEQAIDRYPFKAGERAKVQLELAEDFDFMGVELLMIYIFFNLIKNALYSMRSAQVGEINITLRRGKSVGRREEIGQIIFTDTAEGIPPEVIGKIFDGFFTTKSDGTGAGLTFCKRTLVSFGGDMDCESVYGEYTRFILSLPIMTTQ